MDDLDSAIKDKARISRNLTFEEDLEEEYDYDEVISCKERRVHNARDNNLGSITMKIPRFKGMNNPETYLEWEQKVNHVFNVHNYFKEKGTTGCSGVY